jgi:hypothetical protein
MSIPLTINDHNLLISGTFLKEARLDQEWYEDLHAPEAVVAALAGARPQADIFTFWQRLPDVVPRYAYHTEWEDIAALPVTTYDDWWSRQIKSRTRGLIRKSEKQGVTVKEVEFDDDFVRGITRIFNESPMRQGQPFSHYGMDFDAVKSKFSRYLFREVLIGAYHGDELIGFVMLASAGRYAVTTQIISMIRHRDKGTNNCLIAKAVEICAREKIPYLVYLQWGVGSLAEFKRRMGFEKTRVPRYYVPLTAKGRWALRLGLHRGIVPMIPQPTLLRLKRVRSSWYRGIYTLRDPKALAVVGEGDV